MGETRATATVTATPDGTGTRTAMTATVMTATAMTDTVMTATVMTDTVMTDTVIAVKVIGTAIVVGTATAHHQRVGTPVSRPKTGLHAVAFSAMRMQKARSLK